MSYKIDKNNLSISYKNAIKGCHMNAIKRKSTMNDIDT